MITFRSRNGLSTPYMIMPAPMLVMVVTVDASRAPPKAASHKGRSSMAKHQVARWDGTASRPY